MNRHESARHKDHTGHEDKFLLVPDPRREKRSRDIGELGQFAAGGHYNQPGVTARGRSRRDKLVSVDEINKSGRKKT